MKYIECTFKINPVQPYAEILTAYLGELGFESFTEQDDLLQGYIQVHLFEANSIEKIISETNSEATIEWKHQEIAQENWNKKWEENFSPISIQDICVIHASFHTQNFNSFKHKILIDPKMSFGTGHHGTTQGMIEMMNEYDFIKKNVLDVGCGTGVLGIFAKMLGAKSIEAIDIDDWSIENTIENFDKNFSKNTDLNIHQGDINSIELKEYDIILSNITKNINIQYFEYYKNLLSKNGILILSGFYEEDIEDVINAYKGDSIDEGFEFLKQKTINKWACLSFSKK